ncbi:MAG: enoyl-CoA hydratase-related protein [bacterium]
MTAPQIRYTEPGPDGVARITLDRPEARNAYSEEMIGELLAVIDRADADDRVRAVVLTGAGKAFSAGGDLKRMRERAGMFGGDTATLRKRYVELIQQIPRRLDRFDKPVVAAVNGPAIGAGCDLACMCDLRIAGRAAQFGSTFVKVGLIPGDGGAWILGRTVGFPRALEMVLTGRIVAADEALAMGLVHRVVDDEALVDAAHDAAAEIAALPPIAVQLAKRATYRSYEMTLDQALELAATYQGITQRTGDHDEAVAAMLERRTPVFRGE